MVGIERILEDLLRLVGLVGLEDRYIVFCCKGSVGVGGRRVWLLPLAGLTLDVLLDAAVELLRLLVLPLLPNFSW